MDNSINNNPSQDNCSNSSMDYLQRAGFAVDSGDKVLGIHLYLAAFERALQESIVPSDDVLRGMEQAWRLAVDTKQRSLAEHIFEKLEPFWSPAEVAHHADQLQRLALDKLEEFGLPREALEGMAEMMNQDFMDLNPGMLYRFEEAAHDEMLPQGLYQKEASELKEEKKEPEQAVVASSEPKEVVSTENTQAAPAVNSAVTEAKKEQAPRSEEVANNPFAQIAEAMKQLDMQQIIIPHKQQKPEEKPKQPVSRFDYRSICGFDTAIEEMGKLGIGKSRNPEFRKFVEMLNKRHGLPQAPGVGTLIFRSPSREDANYFMVATVGEMRLPAVRMRLDQNAQGQPVLCVMASADFKSRINNLAQTGFEGPTVVILEDLDLWNLPPMDFALDDIQSILQAQLSRGAREALALIQMALENPEVTVFISASEPDDIEDYFAAMIDDYQLVTLELPTDEERKSVWRMAQTQHPSLRGLDVSQMVDFSRNMSRFEIYAVTTQAVEEAYRKSLAAQTFKAVHTEDIVARLANFQPLESKEYQQMEDMVVADFLKNIHGVDDLLKD